MATSSSNGRSGRLLGAVGLHRPELRAWAMYDWAISGLQTVIMTAVFPIFFVRVAGYGLDGSEPAQRWAIVNFAAALAVAALAPVLGALSDYAGIRKKLLVVFMLVGVVATAGMFFIGQGDLMLASTLFVFAIVGATASMTFYGSLLPHIASPEEMDRVSTAGYALGYVGGGLLLAINLAWILDPAMFGMPSGAGLTPDEQTFPTRVAFLSVAAWWLLFSIPVLRGVREPPAYRPPGVESGGSLLRTAFVRLGRTLRELRGYRNAFLMLLAFMIYNDGIQTIIKMATVYGTEIGIDEGSLITAILIVQFVGIPFAFLFGMLAGRIGAKRAIFLGLAAYTGIAIVGYFMTSAMHFYVLAGLVGMVQGGTQALSRSLFASLIPRQKSGEFFGFFSVFEKFTQVLGPLVFALTIAVFGSSRNAVLSVILFFAVGAALLALVDVGEGQRAARAAERDLEGARV